MVKNEELIQTGVSAREYLNLVKGSGGSMGGALCTWLRVGSSGAYALPEVSAATARAMLARLTGEDPDSLLAEDKNRLAASLGLLSYACDREGMHALLLENLKLVSRSGTLCEKANWNFMRESDHMPSPPAHTLTADSREGRSVGLPQSHFCATRSCLVTSRMAACLACLACPRHGPQSLLLTGGDAGAGRDGASGRRGGSHVLLAGAGAARLISRHVGFCPRAEWG
jgi:hypothetical protein